MIDLINVSLQFGGKYLFREVSFKINSGDRISLVGANGTGKSSLLKMIFGELFPEAGKIQKQKRITIGYLPQQQVIHEGKSLLEEAKSSLTDIIELQKKETEITEKLSEESVSEDERDDLIHQLGEVHHRLEELGSYSVVARVEKILLGIGFQIEEFEKLTNEFSGGWQMRIALAKILISQNDLILMDEPTNHLDIDSLNWLCNFLKGYKGALLIVSHDKRFVNEVTNKTLEIYNDRFNIYNGNYDAYLKFKEERDIQAQNSFLQQQKKIKETEKFIERFRYKATKAKQVQSRIKQLEKVTLIELPENKSDIYIKFPAPPSSGKINIELKEICKSFGRKTLFNNVNFEVSRGEKIAFVGPNGAGKTTLAKIIAGVIDFNDGERIPGYNTIISYYAQDVADNLDPDKDIIESVEDIAENKTIGQLRLLLGSFLFSGDDVFKPIGVLSGGEKSRVALAKILLTKANFIILDEPTNHLDISSKEVLQKALSDFTGSLILVSHDVDFLKPIVNKVIEIRKGEIAIFNGGIEYYLDKKQNLAMEETSERMKKSTDINSSRRDQKRIDAELRQKKYIATKDLIQQIEKHEKEIELLEKRQKELERILAEPSVYSNPQEAKERNLEYIHSKGLLDQTIAEWEKFSENLHNIEKLFP
jgi:ATP-binding cassette subfamily F protein 3